MSTISNESTFEYRYYRLMLYDMIEHIPNERIIIKSDTNILNDHNLLHIKTIDFMWDLVIQKLTYNNYDWTIYGLVNDLLCYDNNISMDNIKKIITIYDKFVDLSYNYRRLNINVNHIRDVESGDINYFPSKGLFYDDINFYKSFYVRNCLNYNNNLLKILWVYNTI
jgi:hypothetical protein